jgi:hypothetical protein
MKINNQCEHKERFKIQIDIIKLFISETWLTVEDYSNLWYAEAFCNVWNEWIRDKKIIYEKIFLVQKQIKDILS